MQHRISHTIQISNTWIYVHITISHKSKYISSQIHISSHPQFTFLVHKFKHTSLNISSIALDQDIRLLFVAAPLELRHLSAKSS
uniref:Uncharacterized protein n=1 Tax=Zea mays TaxID=4577 RepID=B8A2Y7_MAIZE|nr:unknown [Zea mays]